MRFATLAFLVALSAVAAAKPPNVVVVLTDDQGYGDLSCHGNPILKTPHLDRLHARSVRFTRFQASPTCAPTRAALLTGRHEFKGGVTHTIHERERLNPKATTLAEILKGAGYATGIFGKWHLGDEPAYQPARRGFDETFIHGAGGIGQTYPGSCGDAPVNSYFDPFVLHNGVFEKTKGYCTDVFFDRAVGWIDARRRDPAPFLCWIATNAPHAPLDVPAVYEGRYADKVPAKGKKPANVAKFFGMIANIDDNVGKLLDRLDEWKLTDDTIVVFMTDNGGTVGLEVFNAGMRSGKVTPYEGGTRVPCFVSCPKRFPRVGDRPQLTAHVDLLPTLAELAGAKLPPERLDGHSLVPLLADPDAKWEDRTLFTHVGRWEKGKAAESKLRGAAVRTPRHRLVSPVAKERWELYDLTTDPGEKTDLAAANPEIVRDLSARFDAWWKEVTPLLVNEDAVPPRHNAFHELFWKQYGKDKK